MPDTIRSLTTTSPDCPRCGHANRPAARFCAECGSALQQRCPSCGAALAGGARFCDNCGAPTGALRPVESRKVVTVLFADLAGSTALQEAIDVESARRVMTRFYEEMRDVVGLHRGIVAKFIGDAVLAVFGMPIVHEDDALRALSAAAAMGAKLRELNVELEREWGVRLRMRTGLNTGEIVVNEEDVLVGDAVNTAARLEQAAGEDEVLVGEATWRLVHHAAELERVPALELKGKTDKVRAWRLIGLNPSIKAHLPRPGPPLVARRQELASLRSAFDDALHSRECRLVTVMGSPGVGKTRLAQELAKSVSAHATVVHGTCEATGEGITFLPVVQVLRTLAGIGEADPPDAVRAKLAALGQADDPDRERMVERVAAVLGIGEPASPQETFWALRRGVESVARQRPLVLVLDDLHWAEPMLLDLVEHLVEWVSDAPVLIVALARPELREIREALTSSGRRASNVIELGPLDDRESRELVGGLIGELHGAEPLAGRILERAEGNPLFLGETVRMLVDDGLLKREGEDWVATGDIATIEMPPTIHALLAARIERLDARERAVVERAAVIGKEFYPGAVLELADTPMQDGIDDILEALRRKDLVEPEGIYWIDEPVYRFHHVLIRDAAYRTLLKEARADLHERFAGWLEAKVGERFGEHEDVIAFHLEQAHEYRRQLGRLHGAADILGTRAAQRLRSAGRRALAREDLAAAANLLARALARETGPQAEILWDLCEAVLSAGDTTQAAGLVERFGSDAEGPGDGARAQILQAQLSNLTGSGSRAQTAAAASAAAQTLAELGDRGGEAKGWQVAAQAYAQLGQVGSVEEALDRALAAARATPDRRRITAVLAAAPRAALWGPTPVVRASGRCIDAVRVLRMTSDTSHVEAIALRCQAVLEAMRGRSDAAREILDLGRARLEELGLTLELHETAVHAGIVELLAGDLPAAAAQLRAARKGFETLGVSGGAAQAAALLGRALVEAGGQDEEALEQSEFAERHSGGDLKTTITWSSARAEALAHLGDVEQALGIARRATELASPTDALADKADALMALARVLRIAGSESEARTVAAAGAELYERKGHVVGAVRAASFTGEGPGAGQAVGEAVHAEAPGAPGTESAPSAGARETAAKIAHDEGIRNYNAHDLEALLRCYDERFTAVDHREIGWDPINGLEELERYYSSIFAISPDIFHHVDEVLACDDRVIAARATIRGSAADGQGTFEYPFTYVTLFESGRALSHDYYDHDDRASALARYAELGGT